MILAPLNDVDCLGQLTSFARELSSSTLIRSVAAHLGTREMVVAWLRSLPQSDDFGDEHVRYIQCDVVQRARLLPDDPNCVERSMGAMMLLEALDPDTPRALATIDRPLRHTGLVEYARDGHWHAVDLFPRRNAQRNFDWGSFGETVLHGTHDYVGKPILKFYLGDTGGQLADKLGEQEDRLGPAKQPQKKPSPSPAVAKRGVEQPKPAAQPASAGNGSQPAATSFLVGKLGGGAGAQSKQQSIPFWGGGTNGEEKKDTRGARAAAEDDGSAGRSGRAVQAAAGGDRDPHDPGAEAQRFWRSLVR